MIKKLIKRMPGVSKIRTKIKFNREYKYDRRFFEENYSHSRSGSRGKDGYNMLLISHSLEKGMSNKSPRRFGVSKAQELMNFINKYSKYDNCEDDFAFINAVNVLRSYVDFYDEKEWRDENILDVKQFLKDFAKIRKMNVGSFVLKRKDFENDASINYRRFLASRHSVREFQNKRLEKADVKNAIEAAILSPSACNRQMIKIYQVTDKPVAEKVISIAQGFGGFEKDTINLFIVTFDVNANYFIGERNQGWFNAGLFSMNFVNALHSQGIGSCFCQFGNKTSEEEQIKSLIGIPNNERIAVLISAGYYCDECRVPYSPRKSIEDVFRIR